MKNIFFAVFFLVSSGAAFAFAEPVGKLAAPPDAGASEDYLVDLGTTAVPFLIERLQKSENEKYYKGLIYQLTKEGLKNLPDERIFQAFKEFLERNCHRAEVPSDTVWAMRSTMEAMGYLGGKDGVDYLIEWFERDKFKDVSSYYGRRKEKQRYTRDLLIVGAINGLGMSGSPEALEFMRKLERKPPKVIYTGDFQIAIENGTERNKRIQQKGIKRYINEDSLMFKNEIPANSKFEKGKPRP